MKPPRLVFYDFPTSPFCAKVRAALGFQNALFETVDAMAPQHWLQLRRRGIGKAPALEIDGRFVVDSTDICHALHALFPAHPLLPAEPRERALCHVLEDWCDESLYFIGLQHIWLDPANRAVVRQRFPRGPVGAFIYRGYRRLIERQVRGQGTGRKAPAHVDADLERHFDAIEAQLAGRPFLLGKKPWLCDFALYGQLRFLGDGPASARQLAARPALAAYRERVKTVSRNG
ncbi:MAG: glutathione S-transferase family protein [Rubrivivax sp.]